MIKNDYEIRGDITILFLNRRKGDRLETIIDTKNLVKIDEWNLAWHAQWDKKLKSFYVGATEYLGRVNGKSIQKSHCLHSKILNSDNKNHVDHLNHDTLDNREVNLIEKTVANNLVNRHGANRNSTTGVRNVSFYKGKYLVQFQVDGKNKVFGKFDNLEDAKVCADKTRKELYNI